MCIPISSDGVEVDLRSGTLADHGADEAQRESNNYGQELHGYGKENLK